MRSAMDTVLRSIGKYHLKLTKPKIERSPMFKTTKLTAADGHQFDSYVAEPAKHAVAGVVLLPEIFGITQHMRDMAEEYAKRGYRAIVPVMFDRVESRANLTYEEVERGLNLMNRCTEEDALRDIQAAVDAVAVNDKAAVQGYCWGGSLAFLSACELNIEAAVSFYGGNIIHQLHRRPKCPVLFHFGSDDKSIPEENVTDIKATFVNYSEHIAYVYDGADHAFANHDRATCNVEAASLANRRSYEFLSEMLS